MLQKSEKQKPGVLACPQGAPAREQRTAIHARNLTLGAARAGAKQRARPFVPTRLQ